MSWVVDKRLGLTDAISVRVLKVFVECDPSHDCFRGFRMDEPSFTDFAKSLLIQIISSIPSLEVIQFDGYPSVSKFDPLMSELLHVTKANEKRIAWGSERAWGSAGLSA